MRFYSDYLYEYEHISLSNIYIWLHFISIFWHPNYETCNILQIKYIVVVYVTQFQKTTHFAQNSKIELLVSRKRASFPLQNVFGCMLLQRLVVKIHAFSFYLSKMVFLENWIIRFPYIFRLMTSHVSYTLYVFLFVSLFLPSFLFFFAVWFAL